MSIIENVSKHRIPNRLLTAFRVLRNGLPAYEMPGATYDQDGLATVHNCDFMRDESFIRAYKAGEAMESWFGAPIHWRSHVFFWAATRALGLEGDFVECGVHRGGFSRAIIELIDFRHLPDRTFYLLDSFDGFSDELISEEERENGILDYPYTGNYEFVLKAFSEFENVAVIKGFIPASLNEVKTQKISYLSIDLNCAAPEIAAAEFFWDKLVSGAVIVLDDYGWAKHIVQKHAFDEFAKQKRVPILSLPTGQGIIIKP